MPCSCFTKLQQTPVECTTQFNQHTVTITLLPDICKSDVLAKNLYIFNIGLLQCTGEFAVASVMYGSCLYLFDSKSLMLVGRYKLKSTPKYK